MGSVEYLARFGCRASREVYARLEQVTHRAFGAKTANEGLGRRDLAHVDLEPGLDGVDEAAQFRPIASMEQTTQIVDHREGPFNPVRGCDTHFIETT